MPSLPVVFEDCSQTDAKRVSVFELIAKDRKIKKLEAWGDEAAPRFDRELKHWRDGWIEMREELERSLAERVDLEIRMQSMSPKITFWRAVGLIALGVAFGASFVLFGLPKAHAQDYRMPGYEAPPIQYQPLTPPNSLSQGEPQSFSVIPDGVSSQGAMGQPSSGGTVIDNDTGAVLGTYQVNQ